MESSLSKIQATAIEARRKGLDSRTFPEIDIANDLAGLAKGFIDLHGIGDGIRELSNAMSRIKTAFRIAQEITKQEMNSLFESCQTQKTDSPFEIPAF